VGKAVGEKALARATDTSGFIGDPDRPLWLNSEHLAGTLSRQESLIVSRKVSPFQGSVIVGSFPTAHAVGYYSAAPDGLRNTFSRIPDSFSASSGQKFSQSP
jgi:hypothetical protein